MELSKVYRHCHRAWEYMKLTEVGNIVPVLAVRPIPKEVSVNPQEVNVRDKDLDLASGSVVIDDVRIL